MRPVYENAENRSDEERIATAVVKAWGLDSCRKLSLAYGMDFSLLQFAEPRPNIVGFLEAKKRDWHFGDGDGYWLSALKARSARQLANYFGRPSYLAIEFDDGIIRWCGANLYSDRLIWTGRHDRGDPFDEEPHVVYDWIFFGPLESGRRW